MLVWQHFTLMIFWKDLISSSWTQHCTWWLHNDYAILIFSIQALLLSKLTNSFSFTPVWYLNCKVCLIVNLSTYPQGCLRWNVLPPHLIPHGWRFRRGSPGDANLICLTNHPIGRLIHDLWNCEFSSWLIRARTFTWPPLSLYGNVIYKGEGHCSGEKMLSEAMQSELKASSLSVSCHVQNITDIQNNGNLMKAFCCIVSMKFLNKCV